MEDCIGLKSSLGKFTAPRAQSSQAPVLESADDRKVQFDVNDEFVSITGGLGGKTDPIKYPPSLWFTMTEYGYLANPTIKHGV